jgi:hypothetical protein
VSRRAKLAPGSLLTVGDQVRLYQETMGADAAERQTKLADKEARRCTCQPSSVKRRWEGSDKATTRRVHDPSCARFKPWMGEARS